MTLQTQHNRAIKKRNKGWANHALIPAWVDIETVPLDQFFTRPEIAKKCYDSLLQKMQKDGKPHDQYKFIEPSSGTGAFYDLLPSTRRIGIDICPMHDDVIETDFLSWQPIKNGHRYVVVGNPPFGYRAWLALSFVQHAASFADYIGFILPMAFQSDGKGSPKHRVKGMRLLHSEHLPPNSFTDVYGNSVKVNALWQIWKRGRNTIAEPKTCRKWLDLFTVDNRKERLCGQQRLSEADYFLQRTFFQKPPSLVKDFAEVNYACGYGLVIKREKSAIEKILNKTDWKKYSNLAAHNCRHISMYHIQKAVTDAGFADDKC